MHSPGNARISAVLALLRASLIAEFEGWRCAQPSHIPQDVCTPVKMRASPYPNFRGADVCKFVVHIGLCMGGARIVD